MKNLFLVSLVAAGTVVTGCNRSNVETASNEFSALPAPVQKAVRSQLPDAEIADVETASRNGRQFYRIEFRDPKRYPAMELAADGTVVKYEAGTGALGRTDSVEGTVKGDSRHQNLSSLPLEVQSAIEKNAPRAEVTAVRRKEDSGRVIYEVEFAGTDPKPVLQVTVDGTVIQKPQDIWSKEKR
jgi:uncharacterized membrane protein YkoI